MVVWWKIERYRRFVCNICGERAFSYYGKFNGFDGVRCDNCGLAFVENMPTVEELADYYDSLSYYDDYYAGAGYDRAYTTTLRKRFERRIARIEKMFPHKHIRVLEIGAGPGYFSKQLRDAGFTDVSSWDLSDEAARRAASLGVTVRKVDNSRTQEGLGSFDLVVSWATIEHVPDPRGFFDRMMKFVRAGGYLMLDTGVIGTLLDRMGRGMSPWFYPPEHLYVFTQKSLRLLARGAKSVQLIFDDEGSRCRRWMHTSLFLVRAFLGPVRNRAQSICLMLVRK